MKITHSLVISLAILLVAASGCKKKDDPAPDPSGVVLAKVNGSSWEGASGGTITIDGKNYYMNYATITSDKITFSNIRKSGDTSGIYFYNVQLKSGWIGTVNGTTDAYTGGMYMKRYDVDNLINVLGNYNVVYELTITKKDETAKTISGTFVINMTAKNATVSNVSVTEGRFTDLKYK